jgi:uncharacterized pyridoxamine 5'-phosphate oxidase family protein|tara:strand:+ start:267 stop:521 length:255 start_codon:yes stop_codon:yes gene_type:complete
MNKKKLKELKKRIRPIQVEWLRELLPEDQATTITVDNVEDLLPDQTHMFGGGQLYLSFMSDKWIMKQLKNNPNITSYKELKELQ